MVDVADQRQPGTSASHLGSVSSSCRWQSSSMTVAPGRNLSRRLALRGSARACVRPGGRQPGEDRSPRHRRCGGRIPRLFVSGHLDGLHRSVSYLYVAQPLVLQQPSDDRDPVRRVLQRDYPSFAHSAECTSNPHRGCAATALDNDLRPFQQDVTHDLVHLLGMTIANPGSEASLVFPHVLHGTAQQRKFFDHLFLTCAA